MPSFYPKAAFPPDGRKRRKARILFRNNKIAHLGAESRLVNILPPIKAGNFLQDWLKSAPGLFLDLGRRLKQEPIIFSR